YFNLKGGFLMKAKAFISGLIIGTTISSVATLLSTPASGQELRAKGKANIQRIKLGVEQFSEDSKNVVTQTKKTVSVSKEAFKEFGGEMKDSIQEWKTDTQSSIDQLKTDIDALKENIEQ